jgi:hypothetical protein
VYGDLGRAIEQANRERRNRHGALAAAAAAAVVVALVAGAAVLTDDDAGSQQPVGPVTTTPSATPTDRQSEATWEPPGPLRSASSSRVVRPAHDVYGNALPWEDPGDSDVAEVDIVWVREGQDFHGGSSWMFRLAARPPLDPVDRVIAYGVVVDGDGDGGADCQIGVNNDARERGGLHVWVTNLRTHETAVEDGGPYGMPVEFAHPAEEDMPANAREMQFGFLRGLKHPDPCDPFGGSSTFYVWSSVTEGQQVIARDYAPDAAWMPIEWKD